MIVECMVGCCFDLVIELCVFVVVFVVYVEVGWVVFMFDVVLWWVCVGKVVFYGCWLDKVLLLMDVLFLCYIEFEVINIGILWGDFLVVVWVELDFLMGEFGCVLCWVEFDVIYFFEIFVMVCDIFCCNVIDVG